MTLLFTADRKSRALSSIREVVRETIHPAIGPLDQTKIEALFNWLDTNEVMQVTAAISTSNIAVEIKLRLEPKQSTTVKDALT